MGQTSSLGLYILTESINNIYKEGINMDDVINALDVIIEAQKELTETLINLQNVLGDYMENTDKLLAELEGANDEKARKTKAVL